MRMRVLTSSYARLASCDGVRTTRALHRTYKAYARACIDLWLVKASAYVRPSSAHVCAHDPLSLVNPTFDSCRYACARALVGVTLCAHTICGMSVCRFCPSVASQATVWIGQVRARTLVVVASLLWPLRSQCYSYCPPFCYSPFQLITVL